MEHKPAAFSCFGYLYKHFPIQIAYSNQISLVYAFFSNYLKAVYLPPEEHSRKTYRQNLVDSGREEPCRPRAAQAAWSTEGKGRLAGRPQGCFSALLTGRRFLRRPRRGKEGVSSAGRGRFPARSCGCGVSRRTAGAAPASVGPRDVEGAQGNRDCVCLKKFLCP